MTNSIVITDRRGIPQEQHEVRSIDRAVEQAVEKSWGSFITALGGINQKPDIRARDPFGNHVWVYAATMAIAVNLSQIAYQVYRDKPDAPGPVPRRLRSGASRTAVQRHLRSPIRFKAGRMRGLVPEYDHNLALLLHKPNPMMCQGQLFELTAVYLSTKGCCFWLKTRADGSPIAPGEDPTYLWPLNPDYFTPIRLGGQFMGWHVSMPIYNAMGVKTSAYMMIEPHQVVWFRYLDPVDMLGWRSPMAAAASAVSLDMMAMSYQRAVVSNGAKPGGILMHEKEIDADEEKKLKQQWKARYEGPQNANRMAIMTGAFKYIDIGLSPKEVEYLGLRQWDRDEILAALRVPPSAVSISGAKNYAVQLSQDRNFWVQCLIPLMRMIEDVVDNDLFYTEVDDVLGAFDLTKVDALRAGLKDQIDQVAQLTGPAIHMPPDQAFIQVGMEVEAYPGSDVAFVPPTSVPATVAAKQTEMPAAAGSADGPGQPAPAGAPRQPRPGDDPVGTPDSTKSAEDRRKQWVLWLKDLQQPAEGRVRDMWRSWLGKETKSTLELFDAMYDRHYNGVRLASSLIPTLTDMQGRLSSDFRPSQAKNLEAAYVYEEKFLGTGIPLNLDDPAMTGIILLKERRFMDRVPTRIHANLLRMLTEGIAAGETKDGLKSRLSTTLALAGSLSATMTVARTESSGLINTARYRMFASLGIGPIHWADAGDEAIRSDHAAFGASGPHSVGFNYGSLTSDGAETLHHPGDSKGSAKQTINCRCTLLPA